MIGLALNNHYQWLSPDQSKPSSFPLSKPAPPARRARGPGARAAPAVSCARPARDRGISVGRRRVRGRRAAVCGISARARGRAAARAGHGQRVAGGRRRPLFAARAHGGGAFAFVFVFCDEGLGLEGMGHAAFFANKFAGLAKCLKQPPTTTKQNQTAAGRGDAVLARF